MIITQITFQVKIIDFIWHNCIQILNLYKKYNFILLSIRCFKNNKSVVLTV